MVEFTGEDRTSWLQGQVTQDVARLSVGEAAGFCICEPSGRLLSAGCLAVCEHRVVCLVPVATVPAILGRVDEAVFIEDVSVRRPPAVQVWSLTGPGAGEHAEALASKTLAPAFPTAQAGVCYFAARSDDSEFENRLRSVASPLAREAAEGLRLEAGIPRWGIDFDENTLAAEMGPHFVAQAISYAKGCYTGQEVLMRIHSRGHTNRTWMGLVAESPIPPGAAVESRGAPCGRVTSTAPSRRLGFVAGAMLRNDAAKPGEMVHVITSTATVRAEVRHMPLLLAG